VFPEWHGNVTYLQITPRSRAGIPEYDEMARRVGEAVGRINGGFGEASWTPVRYINKAHNRSALSGLYRAARAGLVTPLRDGMNLVAKEYVAAQDPENPGVLILSQFAGAAAQMTDALIVNPLSREDVSEAIHRGLTMPVKERKRRWEALYDGVVRHDVSWWRDAFVAALEACAPGAESRKLETT